MTLELVPYDPKWGAARCWLAVEPEEDSSVRYEAVEQPLDGDPARDFRARRQHEQFATLCFVAWRCFRNRFREPPRGICVPDECPVCLDRLLRPVALSCGHVMDFHCLVRVHHATCPLCRAAVEPDGIYALTDEHRRRAASEEGYVQRLREAASPDGDLGWMADRIRRRLADPSWMAWDSAEERERKARLQLYRNCGASRAAAGIDAPFSQRASAVAVGGACAG
eukprot:tig00000269_g23668.t1